MDCGREPGSENDPRSLDERCPDQQVGIGREVGVHRQGGTAHDDSGFVAVLCGGQFAGNQSAQPTQPAARSYLITYGQLSDVVAQEAKRPVGSLTLGNDRDRYWAVPSDVYETLMYVGDRDGLPTYTITSLNELEPNPPSEAYLRTIARGLGEAFSWTASQRVDYLLRARGVTPSWNAASLAELCDGRPTPAAD